LACVFLAGCIDAAVTALVKWGHTDVTEPIELGLLERSDSGPLSTPLGEIVIHAGHRMAAWPVVGSLVEITEGAIQCVDAEFVLGAADRSRYTAQL